MVSKKKPSVFKAFVSCSLRNEDQTFVHLVCKILKQYYIEPFGTVGKFSASPENPMELMRKNIEEADVIVVCATTRYLQMDIKTGKRTHSISEMLHFEAGMAYANGKPVIVFVKEGTEIKGAFQHMTQYITLSYNPIHLRNQAKLIAAMLNNARAIIKKIQSNKTVKVIKKGMLWSAIFYAGYALAKNKFSK